MLTRLQFRPGFNREQTSYTNEGGWIDGNKVRFRAGLPETIGGWVRTTVNPFLGVCRALINWTSLTGAAFVGVGTNLKYYIERGGGLFDITPIRLTTTAGDVTFSASDGSTTLTVSHTAHGAKINDFVTFSGATSLGGAVTAPVLNQEYQITRIVNLNSYEVELAAPANASDTGDGGILTVGEYQINTGLAVSFRGDGWGAGPWGAGGWGEAADTTIAGEQVRLWSHTPFGESLIINPRGGGLYYWDASTGLGTRAQNIAGMVGADEVPVQVNIVRLSSRDRHVLAFGCTPLGGGALDPLLIRFSAQETFLDWDPTSTNTAGDLRLSTGNQILAAEATNQEIVILTDTSAHAIQFIGPPFTFGLRDLAAGLSVAGPNCAVAANNVVFWMGLGEFYAYDGVVRELPCTIKEYVFDLTMDMDKRDLVFAAHNSAFSEIWWFYPCRASGDCTRYAVYNYEQQIWYYGTMPRSAWVDRGVSLKPVAAALDGHLYAHESGMNDGSQNPAAAIAAYVQSSPLDIAEGDQFMFIHRLIPDVTFRASTASPQVTMTLTAQNFPGGDSFNPQPSNVARSAAVPVEQFTEQTFVRLRGRAVALKVESNLRNTAWRLGSPRIGLRTDGRR
jgi:hypothetical protein